ncbi:MAG: ATP-dependent Clp protease protease subunit [Myxococcota bacterium]|jgi:ATP-dependent Clp protease protease subunit
MPRVPFLLAPLLIAGAVACAAPSAQAEHIQLTNRIATLYGGVSQQSIEKVVKKVLEYDGQSHEPIWLLIDSYGGSVDAGFILIDLMRTIRSPIYAVVTSKAYSMGAIITVFAKKRYIYEHATMMLHEASYGALGEDPSIRSRIEFNMRYLDRIHKEIAERIGMTPKAYRSRIRDAWWVLADDAVKYKMVDAVVTKVTYTEYATEKVEIKRTRLLKQKRVSRPDANAPQANAE